MTFWTWFHEKRCSGWGGCVHAKCEKCVRAGGVHFWRFLLTFYKHKFIIKFNENPIPGTKEGFMTPRHVCVYPIWPPGGGPPGGGQNRTGGVTGGVPPPGGGTPPTLRLATAKRHFGCRQIWWYAPSGVTEYRAGRVFRTFFTPKTPYPWP